MREYGVSQVPVVKAEPPLALAEVVGTVTERDLLARLVSAPESMDAMVEAVMAPPLPMVGTGEAVEVAAARLADNGAVLVVDGGHPTGYRDAERSAGLPLRVEQMSKTEPVRLQSERVRDPSDPRRANHRIRPPGL